MQHAAVAKIIALLRRQKLSHCDLNLMRVLCIDEPHPVRHPDKMRVRHNRRFPVNVTHDQVRRFTPHSGQGRERFHRIGHHAAKCIADFLRHADDIPRLAMVKAAGMDDLLHILHPCLAEGFQRRVFFKQYRRHQVHTRIRTLGGKARGDQQLQRLFRAQGADRVRIFFFQRLHCQARTFFLRHGTAFFLDPGASMPSQYISALLYCIPPNPPTLSPVNFLFRFLPEWQPFRASLD